jgi:major intracellular serine protease
MKTRSKKTSPARLTIAILIYLLAGTLCFSAKATEKENRFIITIIDTGIDLKNLALKDHLCINAGENGLDADGISKANNGKDDDGNGFADDLHGWSFFDESKDIQDRHGHGTHIAGIIYEELKNMKLEKHFCFQVLKYYDSDIPSNNLMQASNDSFKYALDNHSQLVNYSGGGYQANKEEEKWLRQLKDKNVPVIAAMGNQKINTDLIPFFPAGYEMENIFAIGAAEKKQTPAKFSNFGKKRFDFLAPGVAIESFGLNNSRQFLSGTSQATAKATAMVSYMIYQDHPFKDWAELKLNLKSVRELHHAKNKKENPKFIDSQFIKKYKTSAVDAFGEP